MPIFIEIWKVLVPLFCVAIKKDSVSIFRFPSLSHAQVISGVIFPFVVCSIYILVFLFQYIVVFSVFSYVDIAVTGCWNKSFSGLFTEFLESLYGCSYAIFKNNVLLFLTVFHDVVSSRWIINREEWVLNIFFQHQYPVLTDTYKKDILQTINKRIFKNLGRCILLPQPTGQECDVNKCPAKT